MGQVQTMSPSAPDTSGVPETSDAKVATAAALIGERLQMHS
jgi:hypothetical protein